MDNNSLWNKFLEQIKEQISPLSYDIWFKDTKLHEFKDSKAIVIVPMYLHKKHLIDNYKDIMEKTFNDLTGTNFEFSLLLEEEIEENNKLTETVEIEQTGIPNQSSEDANLNKNYTFDSFIVGDSNKFAFIASRAVVEKHC